MGRRGPAPKPTAKKRLHGTYRPDRAATNEPQPDKGQRTPSAPAWMPDRAKEIWRAEARPRWELGVLTPIDTHAFARLCVYRAQYEEVVSEIETASMVQITESGSQQISGWMTAMKNLEIQIIRLEREFGDTPASRSRVSAVGGEDEAVDPYDAFLKGSGPKVVKMRTGSD